LAVAEAVWDDTWHSPTMVHGGRKFRRMADDYYVPDEVYGRVSRRDGASVADRMTSQEIYRRYVQIEYLPPWLVVPLFLLIFVPVLYLLGRFVAAGVGRFIWSSFENAVRRLPLVRNVYSSAKQVTEFMFNQQQIKFTRVVACQYPRDGAWTLGFVTSEGLRDVEQAAGEPVLSVLIPTSPMPVTGFTTLVRKSDTIELNMTIDQAIEYIVSCGVVVPPHQVCAKAPGGAGALKPKDRPRLGHEPAVEAGQSAATGTDA
jgi:uncharacterized membrane protein